jgi:hypothetical protein
METGTRLWKAVSKINLLGPSETLNEAHSDHINHTAVAILPKRIKDRTTSFEKQTEEVIFYIMLTSLPIPGACNEMGMWNRKAI